MGATYWSRNQGENWRPSPAREEKALHCQLRRWERGLGDFLRQDLGDCCCIQPQRPEEGTPPPPFTSEHFEGQESRKFHIQTLFLKCGGEAFIEGLILCTWMEERTYPLLINMMPKNEDILLLPIILNTAVTSVPYDVFQIWFIKLSCKQCLFSPRKLSTGLIPLCPDRHIRHFFSNAEGVTFICFLLLCLSTEHSIQFYSQI